MMLMMMQEALKICLARMAEVTRGERNPVKLPTVFRYETRVPV